MGGIFQKVVARMKQEEKAKAKDDSSITKKPKTIVKPKPKAEDDFEIQELLAWAKNNEPDEGWITNNKIKEIRLRKRYFEKNIDKKWIDYLSSKEKKGIIKIVKKSAIKTVKDDSSPEVLKVQRENLSKKMNEDISPAIEKFQKQKMAKDDSNILKNIKIEQRKIKKYLSLIKNLALNKNQMSSNIITTVDKITSKDSSNLNSDNIDEFVESIKTSFEVVNSELEESDPLVNPLNAIMAIVKNINLKDNSILKSSTGKLKTIVNQLRSATKF